MAEAVAVILLWLFLSIIGLFGSLATALVGLGYGVIHGKWRKSNNPGFEWLLETFLSLLRDTTTFPIWVLREYFRNQHKAGDSL
jgi:hypothetical protein